MILGHLTLASWHYKTTHTDLWEALYAEVLESRGVANLCAFLKFLSSVDDATWKAEAKMTIYSRI